MTSVGGVAHQRKNSAEFVVLTLLLTRLEGRKFFVFFISQLVCIIMLQLVLIIHGSIYKPPSLKLFLSTYPQLKT